MEINMCSWKRQSKSGVEVASLLELPGVRILVHLHPRYPSNWVFSCFELGIRDANTDKGLIESLEVAERAALDKLAVHMGVLVSFFESTRPEDTKG